MSLTDQQYYQDSSNWGGNQFIKLNDLINNFYLFYVGDDKVLQSVKRYDVVFHAKRALQELHYDALKDVKALELELPPDLQVELPKDFVKLVRLSWVDERGRLHQVMKDDTSTIAKAYLQDSSYDILFNNDGEAIEGTPYLEQKMTELADAAENKSTASNLSEGQNGGRFGMDTSRANVNGKYRLDKKLGVIRFSSEVKGQFVVIEYITDGLSYLSEDELQVNKLAEDFLYKQIAHQIVSHRFGIQEYIVRRYKNEAFAAMKNMKIRMMDIHPFDLIQSLKGRNKWIK
ncbi:MAG: putative structural protein [Prokaryotic dsDNA virus sp.]|nr:MAG: putative structural protein [Prokaryotic dsDNA virus sp.]|tara:strand:- start:2445 stop:3308 length:864 start_codon:yes stop_codon:yes gene_type:complete